MTKEELIIKWEKEVVRLRAKIEDNSTSLIRGDMYNYKLHQLLSCLEDVKLLK